MYLEDTVYREHSSWHLHCREMSLWGRIGTWQIPYCSGSDQQDTGYSFDAAPCRCIGLLGTWWVCSYLSEDRKSPEDKESI